ncbi:MAG: Maf family protein [Clostridia bacterium]|nr:Maf family protein [Clostridia bacterium]
MKLILASGSPRRREILSNAGIKFTVVTSDADETLPDGIEAVDAVKLLAERKARATAAAHPELAGEEYVILAADTVVENFGEILGKPADKDDARRMVTMLSGYGHSAHTGICLLYNGNAVTSSETTYVTFDDMTPEEIEEYVSSGEPYDKAGAYAIQGKASLYIAGITGDFFNVMGLPIHAVNVLLRDSFGMRLTDFD